VAGNVLTIRGEKKNGHEERDKNYYLSERSYGSFMRSLRLPFDADPNRVSARCENGILHIAIPKPANMSKSARIPVKAA
jgi:HSP20 family protein